MLHQILSSSKGHMTCLCRHYARAVFPKKTPTATDSKQFKQTIQSIDQTPAKLIGGKRMIPDDPDDFSQYEGDFLNIDPTHTAHKKEIRVEKERIKHRTVQAKYFKTQKVNFLTWSEKEQMRNLHATDPEEWCIEKLADCFPVDCETAAKVVRARWVPRDEAKIRKHDESVRQAWMSLKEDQIGDIDPDLKEHLMKFSGRSLQTNVFRSKVTAVSTPIQTAPKEDFIKILTSCKKYQKPAIPVSAQSESEETIKLPAIPTSEDDTFLLGKINRGKPLMFRELDVAKEDALVTKAKRNNHNPFVNPRESIEDASTLQQSPDHLTLTATDFVPKYEITTAQPSETEFRKLTMAAIKDHIKIPKHMWKEGATYKLNDCYYDDDGEFLYRVPGMTGDK